MISKRKIAMLTVFMLLFSLSFPMTAFAAETDSSIESGTKLESTGGVVGPNAVVSYYRTVVKYYMRPSDIPSSIIHSEVVYGYECYGRLTLVGYFQDEYGRWAATFSGYITGSI